MTPTRGFSAEFGAATTVLVASRLGLPICTTHTIVGAINGVGIARGISSLDLRIIRGIFGAWLVEIPLAAFLTIIFFSVLRILFGCY
jgi:phosphate/sulfate permease